MRFYILEEVKMKKTIVAIILSLVLTNVCFSLTWVEKLLLPEFHGDLATVEHRVIEYSEECIIVEIDGVVYVIKR